MHRSFRHRHASSFLRILLFLSVLLLALGALFFFSHTAVAPGPATVNNQPPTINHQPSTTNGQPSAANADGAKNAPSAMRTYRSDTFNFSIAYPAEWQVQQSSSGTGEAQVTNFTFGNGTEGATMTIMPGSLTGIIQESFSLTNERPVTINGIAATRAQGTSAKDGSAVDLLFFTRSDMLFLLNGKADVIDRISPTLQLTE